MVYYKKTYEEKKFIYSIKNLYKIKLNMTLKKKLWY